MADNRLGERPFADTLIVPSNLVLPGATEPTEFRSRYPDAVRLPVRIVQQATSSGESGASPPRPAAAPVIARPDGIAQTSAEEAPSDSGAPRTDAPVPVAGAGCWGGDPIGMFLRVNDVLDRRLGKQAPEPGTPQVGANGMPQDPNTPVRLDDDYGKPLARSHFPPKLIPVVAAG